MTQVVLVLSAVNVAVLPLEDTVALTLVVHPLTRVDVSVGIGVGAEAAALPIDKVAEVSVSVRPGKASAPVPSSENVVAVIECLDAGDVGWRRYYVPVDFLKV